MPNAHKVWKVLSHGSLERLSDNLWWVSGSLPNMSLKRNMTLVRLPDGRLVVHNGIALESEAMSAIEAWGTPAFLVVPSAIHRLDAALYKARYPDIRVVAPRGARNKVEQVLPVDLDYAEFPADPTLRLETLQGLDEAEGAMIVQSADGATVVLNDAVFNMDRKKDLLGFLFTTLLGSAPGPRVSRLARLMLVKEPRALRADLERLAALPNLTRLIVAHEKVASGAAAAQALRQAATYL